MQIASLHFCNAPALSIPAIPWEMTGLEADTAFVKDLCRWAEMAPSALAKAAGLTPTTILRPHGGTATTRIGRQTMEKLRSKFPDFPGFLRDFPDQVGMRGERPDPNEKPDDLVYIRELDISYAMGDGAVIDDYPATSLIPFNMGFIRAVTKANTEHLFIATGHGESMENTLLRSDLLMIDTSQRDVRQSDLIWALSYAGGGMVKRLRRIRENGEARMLIMSDNPAVPDQVADLADIHIVGKLIWVGRRM